MQPGPYVPPPPVVSDSQVRPSIGWFVFAGGVALAGIAGAIVLWVIGVARLSDRIDDFSRVAVPSSGEVEIDDPGGYSIYHEYFGADSDGDSDRGVFGSEPSVGVTVTDPSGDEVVLRDYTSSVTYDFSGHEGVGIFTFDAEQAGTYRVETTGDSTSTIAVGQGIGRGIVSTIVGGFVVGGLGVVAGIVIAIVTGVRRGRSRRMLNAARWAQAGPPGPGGWGAPPGGGWGPPPGGWGGQQPGPQQPGPQQPGPPPWSSP